MAERPTSPEKLLNALLASIGEAVLVVEPDGRTIRNCNLAAEQLFGYEEGELIGQKTDVLHVDQEHFKRFGELGESVLDRGEVFEIEYEMKKKDGTIIDTYNTVSPIREDLGWKAGVVSIVRDITERKQAERKLQNEKRRLLEAQRIGRTGDWYYHLQSGQISWTPILYDIFERNPDDGPPAYEELQLYFRESWEYLDDLVNKAINKQSPYSSDLKIRTEEGNERYIHIEGKPQQSEDGEVTQLYGIVQDITEREKAFKRENQLKELFYQALEMAPLPVILRKEDGRITYMNEAYRRRTGYDNNEIQTVRDWIQKALPHLEEDPTLEKLAHVFELEQTFHGGEFTIQTKEGEHRIWDFWASNLGVLPGEEQQTAVVMAADITDLREMQDKMQLEVMKFAQLFTHSPDGIAITDPEGQITETNRAFEDMFGYEGEEVKGKNIDRLLTSSEEEYEEARRNTERLKQGERYREETKRCTKANEKVWVSLGGAIVEIDDQVRHLFHIYTDITKRKKAEIAHIRKERELKTLFSNLPGMAYRCQNNRNYTMLFVSDGCKEVTGYKPEEIIHDKKIAYGQLIHPEDRDYVWEQVQAALQEKGHFEIEYRIRSKQNEMRWVWERGTAMNFEDEDRITLQGFISDITARKEQEKELANLLKQKDTLIKEIHHRVKNNMAIISGLLELQEQQLSNEKAIGAIRNSQLRIQTMASVHERLYREEDLTDIRSKDYIENLLELHQGMYAGSDIAIESDIQSFELNVNQAVPLGLLLNELITNAYQHAFPENAGGVISIRLQRREGLVYAEVKDDGRGMDEKISVESPDTLGFTIINTLKQQLEAEMEINSDTEGTCISIEFSWMEPKGSASNLSKDIDV